MRLSDPILVYGNLDTATHILIQKNEIDEINSFYSPQENSRKICYYTKHPEDAQYFDIKNFVEKDFHEIIENTHPSDKINVILCNFADKNPNDISKDDIYNYISYKEQQQFGYFSTFLIELQDEFTTQRERIDSILRKPKISSTLPKLKYNSKPQKDEEQFFEIVEQFDKNEMVGFVDSQIKGDKLIVTRGVLEKYYNRDEIIEYSDQLKPNTTERTNSKYGLRYTTSFKHPFGKGIIKEAIPPKIKTSIYEYFEPSNNNYIYKENKFLTNDDLRENSNTLYKIIDSLQANCEYECKPIDNIIILKNKEKSIRIKTDPEIWKNYPNVQLGSIVYKSEPPICIIPTNETLEEIEETSIVENTNFNLFPMSKIVISVQNLLEDYLHSKLYNIPITQIRYKAKWKSGHITNLDTRKVRKSIIYKKYQTPFEQVYESYEIEPHDLYGISIDVSNVAKRSDLVDLLRHLLIEYVAKNIKILDTTISVEFGDRIIVKVEPFYKKIDNKENTLYIHADNQTNPDIRNFTKQKWNQLYSKWANEHKDLIKSNELNQKFDIDSFWSVNRNSIRTDKRIEPPVDDVYICYVNFHPKSNDIKIGRSKSWESRYSLYTRTNPPVKTIDPNSILRYYLKCPVHKDSVITNYLYVCMEDFFKQFSDKQQYLKRHKTEKGHVTEYYSINSNLELNDQLNQYVADLTEAFSNLTLKDLADMRKPSNKDGIHGGKRQEFFNKVNQYTKEQVYNVEQALQIIANLNNTTKFKDYPDFEKLFLPKFK